jgi:vacuolar-type H+-ATPase subunit H
MKKYFKILAAIILAILLLIVALPFVFQNKIVQIVKDEINQSVNAKVDFGSARLSLIRSFPDFSLSLNDLSIIGNEPFESDTLFLTDNLRVTIDVKSVFRGSPYEIKRINLNNPELNLLVLADGSYNWDIMLPDDDPVEELTPDDDPLTMNIKALNIKNGRVIYDDAEIEFITRIEGLDGRISGNLSTGLSDLYSEAKAKNLVVIYEGLTYMSGVKADYKGTFLVDLDKDYYTMSNNRLYLNALGIEVDGGFGFVDDGITMAINFNSTDENFKNLLSLIPAIYARDFDKVRTDGQFSLNGHVSGLYGEETMPGFGLELAVSDANFSYPDLPESINNIFIKAGIDNKSGEMDDTMIDVDRFDFTLAGNPVKSRFFVRTPMSDPNIDVAFSGKLDLPSLSQALPLEPEETLAGLLEFDAQFAGKMSDIENARYNNVSAGGFMAINDLVYNSSAIELPFEIHRARMSFSPAYLDLTDTDLTIGRSKMQASGRIENYLAYYLGEGYLMGTLSLNSELLDVNELMAALPADETPEESDEPMQIPDLPERIDFTFKAKAGKIYYENFELNNAIATITYKDQVVHFNPLTADMLAGKVNMKGKFDATEKTSAFIDMDFQITRFDIPQAYQSIGMLSQVAPVADKTSGTFSTGFKLRGRLDQELNPLYETLQGSGTLRTSQLRIDSVTVMEQLAALLGNNEYSRLVTDGIDFAFEILNGIVLQKPFTVNYGGTSTTMGGTIGFDQNINYDLVFQIPYEKLGSGANQAINKLVEGAAQKGLTITPGSNLNVNAKLTGLVTSPKIELDYKAAASNIRSDLEDAARKELEKQKEEALKKVSQEAEKILSDAQQKSDEILRKAEEAAAKIRSEAASAAANISRETETQAKKIEDEGKKRGPLAELAARESARQVRTEGENSAQRVINEADKRANDVIREAQNQADGIMQQAREQVDRL